MNKPYPTIRTRATILYEQLPEGGIQLRVIAAGPPYGKLGDHVTQLSYKQLRDLNILQHLDLFVFMLDRRAFNKFYENDIQAEKEGVYDGCFTYMGGEATP